MSQIKQLIKKARTSRKLSQQQVADRMNMHQSQYARMESGQHDMSFGMIERFCGAVEMTVAELIADVQPSPEPNPEMNKEGKKYELYCKRLWRIPHKERKAVYKIIDYITDATKK